MKILDTTIRDGSYAVNFKFSCDDVRNLVSKSDRLGIEYIEIGHGQGLNASSAEHGRAMHTDIEYMEAARSVAPNAKLGFFCIPGIARLEDIKIAKEHGMDFVRIGVNITEYSAAYEYIKYAKKIGIFVFVNFMKSYVVSPTEFAIAAENVYKCGAQCVYIVDSAGCMLEVQIKEYIDAIRERSDVLIGFHGHNNMGLAVYNTISCVKNNIDFIDCSYQGIGRSCGNASLEQVVMNLKKVGYDLEIDMARTLEYGYSGLRNIVNPAILVNPLDYVCGYAGFHSSYLKQIYKCCNEIKVDPLRLVLAYSQEDMVGMDIEKLYSIAKTLPKDLDVNPYGFGKYMEE